MSYLPLMLKTNEIGNICHEHLEYYSLQSFEHLLGRHDFEVVDVELNDINEAVTARDKVFSETLGTERLSCPWRTGKKNAHTMTRSQFLSHAPFFQNERPSAYCGNNFL